MARIYVMCDRYDDALDELEYLLSIGSQYTVNNLRLDEGFKPLRDHSRFVALLQQYAL